VRQELIEVSHRWQELSLPGSCCYQPSTQELQEHHKHYQAFETAQKLKLLLMTMLKTASDGSVPNEAWGSAREANQAALNSSALNTQAKKPGLVGRPGQAEPLGRPVELVWRSTKPNVV
jgi:hypothetical protein